MIEVDFKVDPEDLAKIEKLINRLPDELVGLKTLGAYKSALRPSLNEVRDTLRRGTGTLAKSYRIEKGKKSKDGNVYVVVRSNPRARLDTQVQVPTDSGVYSYRVIRQPVYYNHLIQGGTSPGTRTVRSTLSRTGGRARRFNVLTDSGQVFQMKQIRHPGSDAIPAVENSWKSNSDEAYRRVIDYLIGQIEKLFRRA